MTCPPPAATCRFLTAPAALSLLAGYEELTAFCETIKARSEGLNFDVGSLPRVVLSIYMAGGVHELRRLGELEAAECVALCRWVLQDSFCWPGDDAEARATALCNAASNVHSPFYAIFVQGADAFFAWRIAPQQLDAHDFRAALEIFPQLAARRFSVR